MQRWIRLIVSLCLLLPFLAAPALAADYSNGVAVTGNSATIWFKSNVSTTWVDVHYKVNNGPQQNLRSSYNAATARYEQKVDAVSGNLLAYSFTYNNGNPAYDTPVFTQTVGAAPTSAPTTAPTTVPTPKPTTPATSVPLPTVKPTVAPTATPGTGCYAAWNSGTAYNGGAQVSYASRNYTAKWWTQGEIPPNSTGDGKPWNDVGACGNSGVTPVPTTKPTTAPTATPTAVPTKAPTAVPTVAPTTAPVPTGIPTGNGVMTIQLLNGTKGAYPDSQVYWSIIGYNPDTKQLAYVDASGKLVPATVADNNAANRLTKNGQTYSNYFQKLSDTSWVSLPRINSGRMFISVGSPMYIKINTTGDGATGFAGPDLGNPTDPNQDVYFEWVEFTVDQYGYHGNSTRVDQFGFPITTRLISNDGYDKTVGETESRATIFSAYQNNVPAEFKGLVRAPYRIIAPGKGSFGPGGANASYFDNYVNQVWSYYTGRELTFTAEAGTFSGHVVGNDFVFSKNGGPYNLYIRGKPTTQAILEGSGNLATGTSDELVVQAQITAAFNRHLIQTVDQANWANASYYYLASPANYYAKFWHDHSLNGLAYGFCYDDVRNHSSLLEHGNPKALIVNIGW
ncbi:Glucan endo-1,3-beta-glucosidase [Andreprevotia sp. IGB-42]|uniref:beta-1,3-glucanase family protein n=1 Tax=Andreprevotia sp. IGB-42 TaxID=2497473 RepID=UPI001358B271|nr:beta-1,3-glucanase family protein [Andreprevotia sp. IGB-42]KAF0813858.1 Glucan endo-1,3-beta-glucosidase [Andreprevotia sp. IGB-42]